MDFVIPAGSAANLPKEMVDKIVELAVEKSIFIKLMQSRDHYIEIVNEGTVPVLGATDLDKVYRIDTTTDITTLTENDFDIQSPDLFPVELGTYMYLKRKQVAQYPALKLDKLFREKISNAIARTADKITLIGNTDAVGATNTLNVTNGIATIAASGTLNASTAVTYTTSDSQSIINAVIEAQENIGLYGDTEHIEDLVIFASGTFYSSAKKSANKDYIGFALEDYAPLNLKKVVHIDGIPVIKRRQLTGEQAVLANLKGAFSGYYGKLEIDVEHKAGRRADLLVITFWYDFKWALLNSSSKAEGLVKISKSAS